MTATDAPRTFVSYAWTTPAHQERVRELVDQLRRDGVDALLDVYHLRPGMDANAYMEQVAAQGDVRKVIVICDPNYVRKFDARQGGVGREGTIMSEPVFKQLLGGQQAARKFVAVVFGKEEGIDPTPALFASTLHIDMTDPQHYAERYDELLRFLFDQPLLEAPPVGQRPAHLQAQNASSVTARTWPKALAFRQAVAQGRGARAALSTYLSALRETLREMPPAITDHRFDFQGGLQAAEERLPLRDEFIDLMRYAAQHDALDAKEIGDFFEQTLQDLITLNAGHAPTLEYQFHQLMLRELFHSLTAVLIQEDQPAPLANLTNRTYFLTRQGQLHPHTFGALHYVHEEFRTAYNQANNSRWISPEGEWLFQRAKRPDLKHHELMQADALLLLKMLLIRHTVRSIQTSSKQNQLRGAFFRSPVGSGFWYPVSAPYWRDSGQFQLFQRWQSAQRYQHWQGFTGVAAPELQQVIFEQLDAQNLQSYGKTDFRLDGEPLFSADKFSTLP